MRIEAETGSEDGGKGDSHSEVDLVQQKRHGALFEMITTAIY